ARANDYQVHQIEVLDRLAHGVILSRRVLLGMTLTLAFNAFHCPPPHRPLRNLSCLVQVHPQLPFRITARLPATRALTRCKPLTGGHSISPREAKSGWKTDARARLTHTQFVFR